MTEKLLEIDDSAPIVQVPFGVENRNRMLDEYFDSVPAISTADAWRHIYRLLLWLDPTTGLAHCYESDKSQPGRPWYARSLAFHTWLSRAYGVGATELGDKIDLLFKRAVLDLARLTMARQARYARQARQQLETYANESVPAPGEDQELVEIVSNVLQTWLRADEISVEAWQELSRRVRAYVGQENKRKNLVGEGFEDTLAALMRRIPGIAENYQIYVRPDLHDLPGFYGPRGGDKTRQVDLALVRRSDDQRTLVTCKWSVRSDREEQFATDLNAYARLESAGRPFHYTLVTNEFDPARLSAACDVMNGASMLFESVIHVNPTGPLTAYSAPIPSRGQGIERARNHITSGRLKGIEEWLATLAE